MAAEIHLGTSAFTADGWKGAFTLRAIAEDQAALAPGLFRGVTSPATENIIMDNPSAVFGFPNLWDAAYKAHENVYQAIDRLQSVANELVNATENSTADLTQVLGALTVVNMTAMTDVIILTGNDRGTGAMKVARSMFEVSITAHYLQKNPHEIDLYSDFAHVIAWRQLQQMERISPSEISPDAMREGERQYNRVKGKFQKKGKGPVRYNWSDKSIRQMAKDIGRANLFEMIYPVASMLHHVNAAGLIGHEMNWNDEALRIGHGSLLQTVVSLSNAQTDAGFGEKLEVLIAEFDAARDVK
jgi:Family of unknown function (DUF5677)